MLQLLRRTKNDQDTVRASWLAELTLASPAKFNQDDLQLLESLIDDALAAHDISQHSLECAAQLTLRLLSHASSPETTKLLLEILVRIAAQRGGSLLPTPYHWAFHRRLQTLSLNRLPAPPLQQLPRGAEHALVNTAAEVLQAINKAQRRVAVVELASGLGRRGWHVPKLQELLKDAAFTSDKSRRYEAIRLWLDDPQARDERVEELLANDASVVSHQRVFQHLHYRRQDLLDPILRGETKLFTHDSGYALPVNGGFHRWLPRQQAAFAKRLEKWLRRKATNAFGVRWGLRLLASLPTTTIEQLATFLSSEQSVVCEAALAALPCLDQMGVGVESLLEHVSSDAAKVAIYALPRALDELDQDTQCELIESILQRDDAKITVQKEALRLLGRFRGERSLQILENFSQRPQVHRSLRIAVGHAACRMADAPRAWDILQRLAQDTDANVLNSLLATDPDVLTPALHRRYVKLLLPLGRHDDSEVREHFFSHARAWCESAPQQFVELACQRVVELEDAPEWLAAARLAAEVVEPSGADVLIQACTTLMSANDRWSAEPDRDLPSLQRLRALAQLLIQQSGREGMNLVLEKLADLLATDVRTDALAAHCRTAALASTASQDMLTALEQLATELERAPHAIANVRRQLDAQVPDLRLDELTEAAIAPLCESPQPWRRLTGLLLLEAVAQHEGWPAQHRRCLRKLRDDPSTDVRRWAHEMFTDHESRELEWMGAYDM